MNFPWFNLLFGIWNIVIAICLFVNGFVNHEGDMTILFLGASMAFSLAALRELDKMHNKLDTYRQRSELRFEDIPEWPVK